MSRPRSVITRISKNIALPEDLVARMELELYSEADGRIPVGAQSQLIEALLRQHYTRQDKAMRKAAATSKIPVTAPVEGA